MPWMALVFWVFAVVLVATPVHAQYFGRNKVHYDRLEFRVLRTEHFDIHYYDEERIAAGYVARMAERWYARFAKLLGHQFTDRQVLVLYASHPHFTQTNLTPGSPGEGVGGFTERMKSRIAMPIAAGLGETDHVLGHEIAHAFQIDIAKAAKQDAFVLPEWFIEGMAEFLSLGPSNAHTSMWLRDAAMHGALPSLEQLADPRFFPYRYGHALWSYLAARFGDDIVGRLLREPGPVARRLESITGLDRRQLTRDWQASIRAEVNETMPDVVPGRTVVAASDPQTRLYIGPSLSPDGERLMFMSERDRLSLDLYMADTETGHVTKKMVGTATDPHFDSLQYIHSSGAWDSSGRRFAIAALGSGKPVLTVVDTQTGSREEYALPPLGEIYSPSWSPDGSRLVFSALEDGLSDLYVFTIATRVLTRLTDDAFADLHPAWSPDGRSIAFASDRFTSSVDTLAFGPLRLAVLDVESGAIREVAPEQSRAKQINPQWTPDSRQLYFVSDPDEVSNVYRIDLATGERHQVTAVAGGVSGITASSPAIAVASRVGTLAYSVYRNGRYEIRALAPAGAMAGRPIPTSGFTPGGTLAAPTNSLVSQMIADPTGGEADGTDVEDRPYDHRLRLESITPPYIGGSTGGGFGGGFQASVGFSCGDLLKDRQLVSFLRVGTRVEDFAAQLAYMNRSRRLGWGVTGGFVPSRFFGARQSVAREGTLVTREITSLRYTHQWVGLTARYGLNRSRRLEFGAGVRRTGYTWQTDTSVIDPAARVLVGRNRNETPAGTLHLVEAHLAFVHDTAVFGGTSPIVGERYRFEVEPAFGESTHVDVRLDYRRYMMPVKPFTIAARVEHVGRYGPGARDPRLTPLVYGLQTLVRGYDLRSFAAGRCGLAATSCSILDELAGTRLGLLNLELRAPVAGIRSRMLDYGVVPVEAIAFVDAGFLLTARRAGPGEFDRFRSAGGGARVNLAGVVLEVTAAHAFDGLWRGWHASFLARPGF